MLVAHEDVAPGKEIEEFPVSPEIGPVMQFSFAGLNGQAGRIHVGRMEREGIRWVSDRLVRTGQGSQRAAVRNL